MLKSELIYSVIIVILCLTDAMSHPIQPPKRTCGSDLNDRVSKICRPRGGYQRHSLHSRSRRSIVMECCWNVCPDSNIYNYCSNENVLEDSASNSRSSAVSSTTVYYENKSYQHTNDEVGDMTSEESVKSTNVNFFKSRQYGTISPDFRKETIYVKG